MFGDSSRRRSFVSYNIEKSRTLECGALDSVWSIAIGGQIFHQVPVKVYLVL